MGFIWNVESMMKKIKNEWMKKWFESLNLLVGYQIICILNIKSTSYSEELLGVVINDFVSKSGVNSLGGLAGKSLFGWVPEVKLLKFFLGKSINGFVSKSGVDVLGSSAGKSILGLGPEGELFEFFLGEVIKDSTGSLSVKFLGIIASGSILEWAPEG